MHIFTAIKLKLKINTSQKPPHDEHLPAFYITSREACEKIIEDQKILHSH